MTPAGFLNVMAAVPMGSRLEGGIAQVREDLRTEAHIVEAEAFATAGLVALALGLFAIAWVVPKNPFGRK